MTRTSSLLPAMAVAGLLTACGGDFFSGTVRGASFQPRDAVFMTSSPPGSTGQLAFVAMSDQSGLCDKLKANQAPKSSSMFGLVLGVMDTTGLGALVPGSYVVVSRSSSTTGNISMAFFDHLDAWCQSTFGPASAEGTAGSVELTDITIEAGGSASGTFDVNFDTDRVTGSFVAPYCDGTMSTREPTCI
ncbi:MAG TPA: hypothetical protein VFT91_04710 [Dehalococcoidia bacterium]|nr:hypothetical protein [Dehalococcoidia bacterium]